jgi:BMFP domain-containing protein YqiC
MKKRSARNKKEKAELEARVAALEKRIRGGMEGDDGNDTGA